MKRRYNHETNQWDIVLSEQEYQNIQQELSKLNLMRMEQSRLPISPPFKCTSPCNCSGVCFRNRQYEVPFIQTWCNTNVPPSNLATFLGTGGN